MLTTIVRVLFGNFFKSRFPHSRVQPSPNLFIDP